MPPAMVPQSAAVRRAVVRCAAYRECWWEQPTCGTTIHVSSGPEALTWQRNATSRVLATSSAANF